MLLDNFSQGLPIAIIGYCMVFVVLSILWGFIELMRFFLTSKKTDATNMEEVKQVEAPVQSVIDEEQFDENELVAVLTAAVAASLNTSTYNLRIKSFKKIDTINNAWSNASLNDAINKF